MPVDYFGGYNRGMENLSRAFVNSREQDRRDLEEQRRIRDEERLNRATDVQVQTGMEHLQQLRDQSQQLKEQREKRRKGEADIEKALQPTRTVQTIGDEEGAGYVPQEQEVPLHERYMGAALAATKAGMLPEGMQYMKIDDSHQKGIEHVLGVGEKVIKMGGDLNTAKSMMAGVAQQYGVNPNELNSINGISEAKTSGTTKDGRKFEFIKGPDAKYHLAMEAAPKMETPTDLMMKAAKKELTDEKRDSTDASLVTEKMQEIESRKGGKGFETKEEAAKEAEDMWKAAGSNKAQMPTIKLGAGNKYYPDVVTNPTEVGKSRAEAYGDIRVISVIDTQEKDPSKKLSTMNITKFNRINAEEPGRYVQSSQSPEQKEAMGAAAQRVGQRSANVQTAYKVFKAEAPELVTLRKKVQDKGLLPEGIKDIGAFNQWVGKKTSDPDVAELQKKTKLLADTLQRTIGGTQGGEWAFEVAKDILDPTYASPAFSRIMDSHTKTFKRMADAYKEFGKEETPGTAPQATHKYIPGQGVVAK